MRFLFSSLSLFSALMRLSFLLSAVFCVHQCLVSVGAFPRGTSYSLDSEKIVKITVYMLQCSMLLHCYCSFILTLTTSMTRCRSM